MHADVSYGDVGRPTSTDCLTLSKIVGVERMSEGTAEDANHRVGASNGRDKGFRVWITRNLRHVMGDESTTCRDCAEACVVVVPNKLDWALAARRAVYILSPASRRVAEMLSVDIDEFGFYSPVNAAMMLVKSGVPEVFLAGTGVGSQDVPEMLVQASGAAAKVLSSFEVAYTEGREGKATSPSSSDDGCGAKEAVALMAVMEAA